MPNSFTPTQSGQDPSGPAALDSTNSTMPVIQENQPFNKVNNNVNVQGGGSGGGFNPGSLLGPIGSILGGLFAEGGMVSHGDGMNGYAKGGMASGGDKNHSLATGYLVGALHQKKYGGTPDTLPNAAQEIKGMLEGGGKSPIPMGGQNSVPGMAAGGTPPSMSPNQMNNQMQAAGGADQSLAMQALMEALGLNGQNQNNGQNQTQPSPQQLSPQNPSGNPSNNGPIVPPTQTPTVTSDPNSATRQPQGFATGGPQVGSADGPPGQNAAPLQPGQTFQGDGSVKGPGGPTDDAIPAKLSNGEFVFSEPAVQFFGVDKLNKMNEQGKQGFMQAIGQVQQNQKPQGQPGQAPPGAGAMGPQPSAPPSAPPQMPPMGQAKGGVAMRPKTTGYMGL